MKHGTPQHHMEELALKYARTNFISIPETFTVGEALKQVQQIQPEGRIIYFYAVDEAGRLTGVIPTRRLLLNFPEKPITEIMVQKFVALPDTATLLDACEFFILHRFLAFPIVDHEGKILGVVDVEFYTDEISDLAHRQESEDVFQLIGVRLAQIQQVSIPTLFGRRFPWLLCNIGGGLAAAALAGFFQEILDHVVILALFIPVVLALAESVSIQSLTLTLQAQHGRQKIEWKELFRELARETPVGLLLGLGCAGLVALTAWIWKGKGDVAACLFLSILISVVTATLYGILVPSILKAAKGDPRIASGPITLALTDLTALFYYLWLATLMLN